MPQTTTSSGIVDGDFLLQVHDKYQRNIKMGFAPMVALRNVIDPIIQMNYADRYRKPNVNDLSDPRNDGNLQAKEIIIRLMTEQAEKDQEEAETRAATIKEHKRRRDAGEKLDEEPILLQQPFINLVYRYWRQRISVTEGPTRAAHTVLDELANR
jgi:hypothetical protein